MAKIFVFHFLLECTLQKVAYLCMHTHYTLVHAILAEEIFASMPL